MSGRAIPGDSGGVICDSSGSLVAIVSGGDPGGGGTTTGPSWIVIAPHIGPPKPETHPPVHTVVTFPDVEPKAPAAGCCDTDTAAVIAELRAEIEGLRDEVWKIRSKSHGHQPEEAARTMNARLKALENQPVAVGAKGPAGESITGPTGKTGADGPPGATPKVDIGELAEQVKRRIEGSITVTVEPLSPATSQ